MTPFLPLNSQILIMKSSRHPHVLLDPHSDAKSFRLKSLGMKKGHREAELCVQFASITEAIHTIFKLDVHHLILNIHALARLPYTALIRAL